MANYVGFSRVGNLLFVSGQLPVSGGVIDPAHKGKLGARRLAGGGPGGGASRGAECSGAGATPRLAISPRLRAVRLGGYVNCAPDFDQLPQVVNGASDLVAMVLEPNGGHARFAVGVAQLPLDAAVEVEGIFEILE